MKSYLKYYLTSSENNQYSPDFNFTFDDHEKELIKGLFDLQIKLLIARRRVLLNKLKKDFESEEKKFFSPGGCLDYPFRYTLWEKKRDDKRLEKIQRELEWEKNQEGDQFYFNSFMCGQPLRNKLHPYRYYRELQMHKIREYERTVNELDIPNTKALFRKIIISQKNVFLYLWETKIFLIDYILDNPMIRKPNCFPKHGDFDLILLQKIQGYLNNLQHKDRVRLETKIKEFDISIFEWQKERLKQDEIELEKFRERYPVM